MTASTSDPAWPSRVFPVVVFLAVLFLPWPDGDGYPLYRCVATTVRDLSTAAVKTAGHFGAFQAAIDTPGAGEYVLPDRVQEMVAILRGPGRGVKRYQLSDAIAANGWVLQQMVASAWPRKLERDAKARFILNEEPVPPGCSVMDRQREVSLVYCS